MAIYELTGVTPTIDPSAYIADAATVIGNFTLAAGSTVWSGVVIRGDNELIDIGRNVNVQEGAVLHTDPGYPMTIGADVSIGHQAVLHGCTLGEGSLVGIQAVILNGAKIGKNCLVGAGGLITERKEFPDNSLIVGVPAKVLRTLTEADIAGMHKNASEYVARCQRLKTELKQIG
ncbi:gamma carbonic anhydrase family protein [Massilia sp. R2A-15]|uniref:gamma carbonic anhydrase family protein n=1 Tax=Massilia sp. R2A-15 TaxID=3064278 RepID=UPI00273383D0|nr:gamma carbonic anhydrase family protein [Massilia sp. R2A-15]WLI91180.1 gamma carbonic anhydrase family protein [Massilia sp. R2A-15]